MSTNLSMRIAALEQRVELLEKNRPGPRGKPIVVSEEGVCGVDPDIDSAKCKDATIYRRQKGCMGTACMQAASEYYKGYYHDTKSVKVRRRKKT